MADVLEKENKQLQEEIIKLQNRLSTLITENKTVEPDTGQMSEDSAVVLHPEILRNKCKQLRAQIEITEGRSYVLLPDDPRLQYDVLKDDILNQISQTKDCLKFQEHQQKEMTESIEREKQVNDELSSIVSASLSKCQEIQMDKTSKKLVCDRLQAKCSQLDNINSELRKQTKNFISKNFPLPDKHQFDSVKRRLGSTHDDIRLMNHGSLLSLTEILELLLNANADNPNDPYVVMDHRFWPPYIELLRECDIILRHPSDTRRIKLLPFHL